MLSIAEQKQLLRSLVNTQTCIPFVNRSAPDSDGFPKCGIVVSSEYATGKIRIWVGNVFTGIDPDCEKLEFASADELFAEWEID